MAYQIIWSPEAYDDIEHIAEYIAKDSPFYAQAVVEKVIEASRSLDQFPERARIVPEIGKSDHREIFIYSYRMIFEIKEQAVTILAIIHGRQLLSSVERFDLEQ